MPGSRLPRKIPARRKAAATRLQSAWRARPARREFLAVRAAALKVQVAWLARRRARFAAASRLQRPPLWLGMSSAARHQACRAAITRSYAKVREEGGGFCVYCCEPSPVEGMEKMNERDDRTFCACGIDSVLPFSALPRDPIERRVLLLQRFDLFDDDRGRRCTSHYHPYSALARNLPTISAAVFCCLQDQANHGGSAAEQRNAHDARYVPVYPLHRSCG